MATGTTEFIDNTTADNFVSEQWSKKAIVAREAELLFADLFDRSYEGEMDYGDTLHVGGISNLTAATKSLNTAIVYETNTEQNTDIIVSTWEYSAFALETKTKKQAGQQNLVARYSPKQGYALGLSMDAVGAGLVDDFGTNVVGTLGTPTSYSDWLRASQYLNDANVPMEDRFAAISPAEQKNLMEMDQFINRDYEKLQNTTGPSRDKRRIGTWMNVPVYMSTHVEGTNAAGHDNTLSHKTAAALVVQIDMPSYHFFDIDYFADKYAVECLYGWKEMRDDHGVWVKGG